MLGSAPGRSGAFIASLSVWKVISTAAPVNAPSEVHGATCGWMVDRRVATLARRASCVETRRIERIDGRWYVVAYCRMAKARRTFRLDRIRAIEPVGEKFAAGDGESVDAGFGGCEFAGGFGGCLGAGTE